MDKALGAEINAVDRVEGSGLCPNDPDGPYETAEAVVTFLVTDESGNVLSNGVPQNVTCVSGVDNPNKFIVRFDERSCGEAGSGGGQAGVFDIVTSVSGEAGNVSRTQRIRCRD
jgi:hypothetical protein